jgi:hypothetical protein
VDQRWNILKEVQGISVKLQQDSPLMQAPFNCSSTHQAVDVRIAQCKSVRKKFAKLSQEVQQRKQLLEQQMAYMRESPADQPGLCLMNKLYGQLRGSDGVLRRAVIELQAISEQLPAAPGPAAKKRRISAQGSQVASSNEQQQGQQQQQPPVIVLLPDNFQETVPAFSPLTPLEQLLMQQGSSTAVSADGCTPLQQLVLAAFADAAALQAKVLGSMEELDAALCDAIRAALECKLRQPRGAAAGGAAADVAGLADAGTDAAGATPGGAARAAAGSAAAGQAAAGVDAARLAAAVDASTGIVTARIVAAGLAVARVAAAGVDAAGFAAAVKAASKLATAGVVAAGIAAAAEAAAGVDAAEPASSSQGMAHSGAAAAAAAAGGAGATAAAAAAVSPNAAMWPLELPSEPAAVAELVAATVVRSYEARQQWGLLWEAVVPGFTHVAQAMQQV